jgi:hypothetical protein
MVRQHGVAAAVDLALVLDQGIAAVRPRAADSPVNRRLTAHQFWLKASDLLTAFAAGDMKLE